MFAGYHGQWAFHLPLGRNKEPLLSCSWPQVLQQGTQPAQQALRHRLWPTAASDVGAAQRKNLSWTCTSSARSSARIIASGALISCRLASSGSTTLCSLYTACVGGRVRDSETKNLEFVWGAARKSGTCLRDVWDTALRQCWDALLRFVLGHAGRAG